MAARRRCSLGHLSPLLPSRTPSNALLPSSTPFNVPLSPLPLKMSRKSSNSPTTFHARTSNSSSGAVATSATTTLPILGTSWLTSWARITSSLQCGTLLSQIRKKDYSHWSFSPLSYAILMEGWEGEGDKSVVGAKETFPEMVIEMDGILSMCLLMIHLCVPLLEGLMDCLKLLSLLIQ